ncbi:hypothetical protein ACTG2F_19870 [Aeromonas sp. 31P]
MTIKHTPEPWYLPPGDLIFVSKVGGKGYVAKMMPLGAPRDRKGLPTDISDEMCANARRIVACVNACRGLPTDELEQKGLVAAVGTQLLDADQQRDELLAALEEVHRIASNSNMTHNMMVIRDHCADAIAKAKGGAA